jgi:hypothetical protein
MKIRKMSCGLLAFLCLVGLNPDSCLGAESMEQEIPYLIKIERMDLPIFAGPGYDYSYVETILEPGTYTIVEEETDSEAVLWGKLKSGIGWVDLAEAQSSETERNPLTVVFADERQLSAYECREWMAEESEDIVKLAFRSEEVLKDLHFFLLQYEKDFDTEEELYFLSELTPEMALLTGVVFYGDNTAYGISFTDENGEKRKFAVSISGRNGALIMEEWETYDEKTSLDHKGQEH